jgi:hypothetical protein
MGANAQTTVPTFTAGAVLTADQMNQSARTGVPVFASTVTRDAGFGGTGEKTLAEGQMCYVEGTGFQTYNGSSWVTWGTSPAVAGVIQVVSATKTDAFSTTSTAFVDVTGVSVSITPTSASNKVLIFVDGITSSSDGTGNTWRLNLNRDSTAIAQSTGSGATNQTLSPFTNSTTAADVFAIHFLDSPATTSAITYKLQIANGGGVGTIYIGRQALNDNRRSVTSITVMEVKP